MGVGTFIYLTAPDNSVLILRPASPSAGDAIVCRTYDLGAPQVKEDIEERVGRNGVNDNSSLHGSSYFSADLQVFATQSSTVWQELENLKKFLDPTKRYYVSYQRPGESETWTAIYRPEPWSLVHDKQSSVKLNVSMKVFLPEGCYESQLQSYEMRPTGLAAGFSLPFSLPVSLTASSGTGAVDIPVGGTRPVPFRAIIYGGQFEPVIMDTDTGRKLSFTASGGLDIPLGSYVEVDTERGTALLNGDINNSVYQYIDFAVSEWWALRGGESNRISVSATSSDNSAQTLLYVASRRL